MNTRRILPMVATLAAALVPGGGAEAVRETVEAPGFPVRDLDRRERGLARPFSGGYGWGTSGHEVAGRNRKLRIHWTPAEFAAEAKHERKRARHSINMARAAMGRVRR